ncbi:MAG: hypothetical protein FJ406_07230 [Verrucomicrobia bacterium]|nr:hypothetical protein [Verrucomicrobiota bacterium]
MKKLLKSLALVTGLSIAGLGIGCGDDKKTTELSAFPETAVNAVNDVLTLTPAGGGQLVTVTVTASAAAVITYTFQQAGGAPVAGLTATYIQQSSSVATLIGDPNLGTIELTATSTTTDDDAITQIDGTYERALNNGTTSTGTFRIQVNP